MWIMVKSIELGMYIVKEFFYVSSGKSLGLFSIHIFYINEYELNGIVLYYIIYDNGYANDIIESKCWYCIEFYRKLKGKKINEWGIGGNE